MQRCSTLLQRVLRSVAVVSTLVCFQLPALLIAQDTVAPAAPEDPRLQFQKMTESDLRFISARAVIVGKCMGCHRPRGEASDFTPYLNDESKWISGGYIVMGKAQESLLYKYLIGSGFTGGSLGTMPKGGTLLPTELAFIREWINRMTPASPTPTPPPQGTPTPYVTPPPGAERRVLDSPQSIARVGESIFMKSVLDGVFGPAAAAVTGPQIREKISIFGGVCDEMGQAPVAQDYGRAPSEPCTGVDVPIFSTTFIPQSQALRAGQTMKVCNALVYNNVTLQFAITGATQRANLEYLKTDPIPKGPEVIAAYQMFAPGKVPPTEDNINKLLSLAQKTRVTGACPTSNTMCHLDPWRYTILALCYNPVWQEP